MKAKELLVVRLGLAICIGGFVGISDLVETSARAQVNVSLGVNIQSPGDFYGPLSAYGTWVDAGPHGRCWRPANVVPDWRPYSLGHWEWTDVGWYWASDEPWGWACYHYGQWVLDPTYGWLWTPGTEWAPAWVVWRESPDYIGWAPCGPGGAVVGDSAFVFVDMHHFHDHLRPRQLVFNDPRIFGRSRPIGRFETETREFDGRRRRIAINRGPGVDPIQHATGTRFTPRPVQELIRQTRAPEQSPRTRERAVQPPSVVQQPASRSEREQRPLYREAPATRPAPTGRQEQRIYRELPNPQPGPTVPLQTPRRSIPVPQASAPSSVVPRAQPASPGGFERGREQSQLPRRPEAAPRVEPSPEQHVAPKAPPSRREKERDGE